MSLSESRLHSLLPGAPLRFYESVGSSNDLALAWLREGAPQGAAIIADEQRTGRGRKGRTWYTPPGVALAISYILRPQPEDIARVTLMGAVAVAELCEQVAAPGVGIKWPNDVQIDGRKVCGVLPEAVWDGQRLLGVVLGIGVNIRVLFDDVLLQTAINLEDAAGQKLDRSEMAAFLLSRLAYWSGRLSSADLMAAWRERLTTVGQTVRVEGLEGVVQSVGDDGALILQTPDGKQHRIMAGDVLPATSER